MSTTPTAPPGAPRHWDAELGGIRWFPRLIDKARMKLRGDLGAYLCGHSPVDRALLKRLNMTTDEFVETVRACPTDAAVLEAARAHGMDYPGARRWSERFHHTYRNFIVLWSLDEGYVQPTKAQSIGMRVLKKVESPLMALYRKISPAP